MDAEDRQRVEGEVHRMVAELRDRPTQEKEDALGLEVSLMPPTEREYVAVVLLRMLAVTCRRRRTTPPRRSSGAAGPTSAPSSGPQRDRLRLR